MHTIEDLVQIVAAKGEKVSTRQIREWHRDGLLPPPTREKIPGQGKGRAHYRFPESAPAAVVALARERRYMKSAEDAKLWLWLEGFDYTGVDPDERLRGWLVRGWKEDVQAKCPSVPDISDIEQVNENRRIQIGDELDREVIAPMSGGEPQQEEYAAYSSLLSALLGLGPVQEGLVPLAKALMDRAPYTMRRALPASIRSRLPEVPPEEFGAFSVPDVIGEPVPRQQIREVWRTFCTVTEMVDDLPENLPSSAATTKSVLQALRKMRYSMYRNDPEYIVYGLACVVRFLSRHHPNQLRRTIDAMRALREVVGSPS